ncbi:helix-turn-helix transcriptional regulator [Methylomagnum sp.]
MTQSVQIKGPILRPAKAAEYAGIGLTLFYEKQNPSSKYYDPDFPVVVSLGGRSVGVYQSELDTWLSSRPRLTVDERKKRINATAKSKPSREIAGAIQAAAYGDELIGVESPIIAAAKIVSADIRELLDTLFEERGIE